MSNNIFDNDSSKISDNIFQNINKYKHEEYQYLNLIQNILENGSLEQGRNGETLSIFGASMRFSLQNGTIPILTTKKVAWKTCLKELLWFIRGQTDNKILQQQDVHIWDGNASPEYMESIGLGHYPPGHLGPIYGHQWRNFNATYDHNTGCPGEQSNKSVDQLKYIIDQLKSDSGRKSRRLIMSAWNPCQLSEMALPPCHILCQFRVHDGNKLSCAMYQRSSDTMLGLPFNVASYSFLTHLLAKHCGLEAYEFIHFMGDCHIYKEHIEGAKIQLEREPLDFPTLKIKEVREDINEYDVSDFELHEYKFLEQIKMNMVV